MPVIVEPDDVATNFPWASGEVPPVWVAGYGPKALRTAGRIGDGVILQFADPDLIDWCLGFVRCCAGAGRDFPAGFSGITLLLLAGLSD